jgi:hypothetical protein
VRRLAAAFTAATRAGKPQFISRSPSNATQLLLFLLGFAFF